MVLVILRTNRSFLRQVDATGVPLLVAHQIPVMVFLYLDLGDLRRLETYRLLAVELSEDVGAKLIIGDIVSGDVLVHHLGHFRIDLDSGVLECLSELLRADLVGSEILNGSRHLGLSCIRRSLRDRYTHRSP